MSWEPKRSVVRVLGPKDATAGTGTAGSAFFLTGGDAPLLATCAHVVRDITGSKPGEFCDIEVGSTQLRAYVEPRFWRNPEVEDIAVLRLEGPIPAGCEAVELAPVLNERGSHQSWGFPLAKATEGLAASVSELAPGSEGGIPALQARSEEVSHGFSGAPVWDAEADVVIGMVMSIVGAQSDPGGRQRTTFFLRPTEELWNVCPELRAVPENPYRGLAVFDAEHAPLYFGRDALIATLLQRLAETDFVAVVGPSGCGKSSLVRAGLQKGLAATPILGLAEKPRIAFRPGAAPIVDLELAMREATYGGILCVDQFERIFTDCPDEEARGRFIDKLLALAGEDIKVVITLRADFYGRVLEHAGLGRAVEQGQVTVLPMTHDELLQAVVEPARAHHRPIESALAEQLVDDVEGNPGDLPLLQLALTELWNVDAASGILRASTYQALGARGGDGEPLRLRGVVARLAEECWRSLDVVQRPAATRLLVSLVTDAQPGAARASRRAWLLDFDEAMRAVAERFVEARLMTTGVDAATGQPTVEVAHEALIWTWPRLRKLSETNAEFIRWYDSELTPFLRASQSADASDDLLLRGAALARAELWLTTARELFPGSAAELVERSIRQRKAEAEQRRLEADRERERLHALQLSESLRLASEAREIASSEPETSLLVAWEALLRDRNTLSEAVFREALEHLPAPVRMLKSRADSKVTVGFLSNGIAYAATSEEGMIHLWGLEGDPLATFFADGNGTKTVAATSDTPHLLAYRDGVLRLYDGDGVELDALELPGAEAGSPHNSWQDISVAEGDTFVTHDRACGWLGRISGEKLELLRAMTFVAEFPEHLDSDWRPDETLHFPGTTLFRIALDRHGSTVISEGDDGVRVWNLDGTLRAVLEEAKRPAGACVLTDGTILTGGMGGAGAAFDPDGRLRGIFREDAEGLDLFIEAIDPSGRYAATSVNHSGVVEIRDSSGQIVASLAGHDDHVWAAAFSPDGRKLATGGSDRTVRVWDWKAQRERSVLRGHTTTVHALAFNPTDPSVLLSADQAGEVRLWRLEAAIVPPYKGHRKPPSVLVRTAAAVVSSDNISTRIWSPSGTTAALRGSLIAWRDARGGDRTFVVTSREHTAQLLELGPGGPVERCSVACSNELGSATISPEGTHFAGVHGASVTLWSARGDRIAGLVGDDDRRVEAKHDRVVGVGFDSDSTRAAVASRNGMVWLWTVDGEAVATILADYASPDRIFDAAFDPRGKMIATGVRNAVGLWSWDGERIGKLRVSGYKVFRVSFSPDGSRILTIANDPDGSNTVELWTRSGQRVALLSAVRTSLAAVPVWDDAGRYFCLPSGRGVAVVDSEGARLAMLVAGLGKHPVATALSHAGEVATVAFSDGLARTWSFEDRRPRMTLHVGECHGLAVSTDARELLCATPTGPIERHPLDIADVFDAAESRLGRSLSPEELERFGIDAPLTAKPVRSSTNRRRSSLPEPAFGN